MTQPDIGDGIAIGSHGGFTRRCPDGQGRPRGTVGPAQASDAPAPHAHHPVHVERFAFEQSNHCIFSSF